jgi:hypothetical protein
MSFKLYDLSAAQIYNFSKEQEMKPDFTGQNPYIAIGPHFEMLAILMPGGLYQMELLDKKQTEESLKQTIKTFKDFSEAKEQ